VPIKPYSKKELANMYGISSDTLRKWFEVAGLPVTPVKILNINQVKEVFNHFGTPEIPDKQS
jgi:uncharacterized protein YjcR